MSEMTTHERYSRMFAHKEADRIPIIDSPWGTTIERWHREGMPVGADYVDYFGLDRIYSIGADNGPRWPEEVIEETEEYRIVKTSWGVTYKNWKHMASTPEYLDFTVRDRDTWREAKERMKPDPDRIAWDVLKREYPKYRENGSWISYCFWFGFDITHAHMVGTENILMMLAEDPEWCADMFQHELDVHIALFDQIWNAGYYPDEIFWPDDMGYRQHTFFSLDTYREVLKPVHKKACDWAHAKGLKVHLHSCGFVQPLIPDLIEIGVDALNPLEVKAGMDPCALKKQYGDQLVLHGGINAVLWDDFDSIAAEMEKVIPVVKENGGYIFSSDHSVPDSVSLENFRKIVNLAKELGKYD